MVCRQQPGRPHGQKPLADNLARHEGSRLQQGSHDEASHQPIPSGGFQDKTRSPVHCWRARPQLTELCRRSAATKDTESARIAWATEPRPHQQRTAQPPLDPTRPRMPGSGLWKLSTAWTPSTKGRYRIPTQRLRRAALRGSRNVSATDRPPSPPSRGQKIGTSKHRFARGRQQ